MALPPEIVSTRCASLTVSQWEKPWDLNGQVLLYITHHFTVDKLTKLLIMQALEIPRRPNNNPTKHNKDSQ
jgi:hypothetical protein